MTVQTPSDSSPGIEISPLFEAQEQQKKPISRLPIWDICIFGGIILLGAILRFWALGEKPLHHDESLHAYYSRLLLLDPRNYQYNPLLHGPFQFHIMALVYLISHWFGVPDNGINTTTVRIAAAMCGTIIVVLPYFLRDYLGKMGTALACFLLAISPSMVYYSRFAREDAYMACFTLLLVVAIARYVRSRRGLWLIVAVVAFSLSYATKEATFLTIAVFGSFFGAVVAWELGLPFRAINRAERLSRVPTDSGAQAPKKIFGSFQTRAPITLAGYLLVLGAFAKFFFAWLKNLSAYIIANSNDQGTGPADLFLHYKLEAGTEQVVPELGIGLALVVMVVLLLEYFGVLPWQDRFGLARRIDPKKQPLLDAIVRMPWSYLFLSVIIGWTIFMILFTVLFTNIAGGIGDGIWKGLYYWLEQQQVARGGQPWYYYLLLIPLYEQIGVVFGIVGIILSLRHPSRFRLFLVYWFVGNLFIYSWAGEKMPWLTIHMMMPLILLAAIGLQATLNWLLRSIPFRIIPFRAINGARAMNLVPTGSPDKSGMRPLRLATRLLAVPVILFLLVLTLQNMFQLAYVHYADAPHEMMIYVQTTTDVDVVMAKIAALDQKFDGGRHQLSIAVASDPSWPFYWYLRDYTNVCFTFPTCQDPQPAVIISGDDNLYSVQSSGYFFKLYHLRSWWDEGYKPAEAGGVGLFTWLSYGNPPPSPHASFDLGRAAKNIWLWWWQRQPFGSTMGSTDMGLLIRKDLGMRP